MGTKRKSKTRTERIFCIFLNPLTSGRPTTSQPTINLINNSITRKLTPIPTTLRHHPRYRHFLNILRSLKDTNIQASANMPSDMAMKGPDARIILVDLEDDVGGGVGVLGGLHPHGVAALGVRGVGDGVGVFAEAFCEDVPLRELLVGSCGKGRGARGKERTLTCCGRAYAWGVHRKQSNCTPPDAQSCWTQSS